MNDRVLQFFVFDSTRMMLVYYYRAYYFLHYDWRVHAAVAIDSMNVTCSYFSVVSVPLTTECSVHFWFTIIYVTLHVHSNGNLFCIVLFSTCRNLWEMSRHFVSYFQDRWNDRWLRTLHSFSIDAIVFGSLKNLIFRRSVFLTFIFAVDLLKRLICFATIGPWTNCSDWFTFWFANKLRLSFRVDLRVVRWTARIVFEGVDNFCTKK